MVRDPEQIERAIRAACDAGELERGATLLLQSYGREIFAFLMSRLRDDDATGEVFSQFTEDLWRGLGAFGWRCSARVWAYTLARNAASRYLEDAGRRRRRQARLSGVSQLSKLEQKVRTETLAFLRSDVKNRIAQLRERLPADDQSLLLLRVNRELDWREIAQVFLCEGEPTESKALDREAARLRKRFQLVKEQLRKMARDEGLIDGDST